MKLIALLACMNFLGGCDGSSPTELEGVWRSNLELTIRNLKSNDQLKPEMIEFLKENLGDLHVSFRGNESRVFFIDVPESDVEPQKFKVVSSSENEITIKIIYDIFSGQEVTYQRARKCIYLSVVDLGYDEYFCRL